MDNIVVSVALFSDDTSTITRKRYTQQVERDVIAIMQRFGETVHPGKTKRLLAAPANTVPPVGFLSTVRLLGGWFDSDGGTRTDDDKRIHAARLAWRRLHRQLPRLGISAKMRGAVVQAAVISSLLYGAEVRAFSKHTVDKYQKFVNRIVRGITYRPERGGTRAMEGVCTSTDLRLEAGIESIQVQVARMHSLATWDTWPGTPPAGSNSKHSAFG